MIKARGDVFGNIDEMWRQMERFMEHVSGSRRPVVVFTHQVWQPLIDVYENPEAVVVLVELAGVKQDEVEISIDHSVLTIKGERKDALRGRKHRCYMMEISFGSFERTIPLPTMVDAEQARASYTDGFLEILLPKAQEPPVHRVVVIPR